MVMFSMFTIIIRIWLQLTSTTLYNPTDFFNFVFCVQTPSAMLSKIQSLPPWTKSSVFSRFWRQPHISIRLQANSSSLQWVTKEDFAPSLQTHGHKSRAIAVAITSGYCRVSCKRDIQCEHHLHCPYQPRSNAL